MRSSGRLMRLTVGVAIVLASALPLACSRIEAPPPNDAPPAEQAAAPAQPASATLATAPANARRVAQSLTHSTYFEIPAQGHAPGVGTDCGRAIIAAFLDHPDRALDAHCIDGPTVSFTLR